MKEFFIKEFPFCLKNDMCQIVKRPSLLFKNAPEIDIFNLCGNQVIICCKKKKKKKMLDSNLYFENNCEGIGIDYVFQRENKVKHSSLYQERCFTKLGYSCASILDAMPYIQMVLTMLTRHYLLMRNCNVSRFV